MTDEGLAPMILRGRIMFEIPPSEQTKLDSIMAIIPSSPTISHRYNESEERRNDTEFLQVIEKKPEGKGIEGLVGVFTLFSTWFAFIAASGGLRELLGAFFDIIGLFSDLIFVAIYPIILPFLQAFIKMAELFVKLAGQPGGILTAIMKPEVWDLVVLYFANAFLQSADKLIQLGTTIFESFIKILSGEAGTLLEDTGLEFGRALLDMVQITVDFFKFDKVVTNLASSIFSTISDFLTGKLTEKLFTEIDNPNNVAVRFMADMKSKSAELASSLYEDFSAKLHLLVDTIALMFNVVLHSSPIMKIVNDIGKYIGLRILKILLDILMGVMVGELVGMVSGIIIGFLIAGPAGAIILGTAGAYTGAAVGGAVVTIDKFITAFKLVFG